jgi:CubicO group peptidase (beta-lactamase class C family)
MAKVVYPGKTWERVAPWDAGFDQRRLETARIRLSHTVRGTNGRTYRTLIVRGGRIVAEWNRHMYGSEQARLASATKSVFSCILGILIAEKKIPSADARVVDYYPEAMDVPRGQGPKRGRHAFPKDRDITFRQLISNTSGYMKPGENPGTVFHYQTYGMNILTHAMAKIFRHYSVKDPEGSPGLSRLIDSRIRKPIGGTWGYYRANFDLWDSARQEIFGYYDGMSASAYDMARLGWLWCRGGRWEGKQIIPRSWLRQATRTNPDILAHCSKDQWKYGYGFWTNDHGRMWPHLPRDSFAARGAGNQHIWVCPSLDMVVVESPGTYRKPEDSDTGLLAAVVAAIDK